MAIRFSLQVEMWSPQRLPVKDLILKRNEGAEGGTIQCTGEAMSRFDLSSSGLELRSS